VALGPRRHRPRLPPVAAVPEAFVARVLHTVQQQMMAGASQSLNLEVNMKR